MTPDVDFWPVRRGAAISLALAGAALAWALVLVASRDHAAVRNAPGVDSLPDFPLDGKVSSINTVTKNAMLARLTARKISRTFIDNTDGYREVIRGIGRQLEPDFDENKFDIADE